MSSPSSTARLAQPDAAYDSDAAFLLSVMASSGDCIKVLDLDANLIYMSEGGQKVMEVSDFNAIRGCPWPDFWQDQGNIDARAAVATARAGGIGRFQGAATTMIGTPKYWDVQVTPILGTDGRPERLLSVSRDITASRLVELELRNTRDRLELALKAGRLGYWEYDLASGRLDASGICKENFGRAAEAPFTYDDLKSAVHPDDRQNRDAAVAHTAATGEDLDVQYRIARPDGSEGWLLVQAKLVRGADGTPQSLAGISLDITANKREEQDRRLLSLELNHRIKNQMAVVQGIVNQALRGNFQIDVAKRMISERLSMLARAHDLLIAGEGERASIALIVANATEMLDSGRVSVTGPDLSVGPKAALSLALIIHELATNAIKYGAFSTPAGRVAINWSTGWMDGQPSLEFSFTESGGPAVATPNSAGFGSRLLRGGLSGAVSTATLDYAPGGVCYRLSADLKAAQSGA